MRLGLGLGLTRRGGGGAALAPITDDFNRANGNLSSPWVAISGSVLAIDTNVVKYVSGSADGRIGVVRPVPSPSGIVSIKLSTLASQTIVVITRYVDFDNFWYVMASAGVGFMYLVKRVSGTPNFLATEAPSFPDGTKMSIKAEGDAMSILVNDVLVGSPVTDSFNNTALFAGFGVNGTGDTSSRMDDWRWDPIP